MGKKSPEDETALAQPGAPTELAAPPDYIEEGRAGLEDLRQQDLLWPRMRLIQSTSDEVKQRTASAGQVLIDLTKQVVADINKEVDIQPVAHFLSWIEWAQEMGEGIVAASNDPKSEVALKALHGATREDGRLAVTEYHNFLVLLPEVLNPAGKPSLVLLSFKGTSHKVGKKLLMLARMRERPLWAGYYALSTQQVSKGGNSWYEYTVDNSVTNQGWAPKEMYLLGKQFNSEFGTSLKHVDAAKLADADDRRQATAGQTEGQYGKSDRY